MVRLVPVMEIVVCNREHCPEAGNALEKKKKNSLIITTPAILSAWTKVIEVLKEKKQYLSIL